MFDCVFLKAGNGKGMPSSSRLLLLLCCLWPLSSHSSPRVEQRTSRQWLRRWNQYNIKKEIMKKRSGEKTRILTKRRGKNRRRQRKWSSRMRSQLSREMELLFFGEWRREGAPRWSMKSVKGDERWLLKGSVGRGSVNGNSWWQARFCVLLQYVFSISPSPLLHLHCLLPVPRSQ